MMSRIAAALAVFHDDCLAGLLGDALRHRARERIAAGAGGVGNDDPDRSVRVVGLRDRGRGQQARGKQGAGGSDGAKHAAAIESGEHVFHACLLEVIVGFG